MKKRTTALESIANSKAVLPVDVHVNLQQNFEDQLKDVFHGGKKLNNALPRLSAALSKEELCAAYHSHLQETRNQLKRLLHVFELLGKKVMSKKKDVQENADPDIPQGEAESSFNTQEMQFMVGDNQQEHFELAALKAVSGVMDMKECHGM